MSHCINAILVSKKEVRSKLIDSVCNGSDVVKYIDLGKVCIIPYGFEKEFSKYIEVKTDYFGGFGEQYCQAYENGKLVRLHNHGRPVNEGLKFLGVTKDPDKDEWDTVGLSKYRSNFDIEKEF